MATVRNKFDTLQETLERHSLNYKYENFVPAGKNIAAECIPIKLSQMQSFLGANNNFRK